MSLSSLRVVDVNWMMAVAALASSHNVKSLDPIDKVTILTLKSYPKAKEILHKAGRLRSSLLSTLFPSVSLLFVKDGTLTLAPRVPPRLS